MRTDASVTTYVVGDRLPWPDDDVARLGPAEYEPATLLLPAGKRPCAIHKISQSGVTLSSDALGGPGERATLQLANGQRCAASIHWARGREAGLAFDEPLDIVALINRNLVAQPAERRTMPRIELRTGAHLKWGEHFEPALTRNISARGIQVEGQHLPPVGTYVALFVEGLTLPPCDVVWRRDKLAGLEFFETLSWASIIPWVKVVSRGNWHENHGHFDGLRNVLTAETTVLFRRLSKRWKSRE